MSSTSSAIPSASSSAVSATLKAPGNLKVVGIILAITSGVLIGSSFVFKKKGLLRSQASAGEGVAYLKSPLWWLGMIMMILGELCNFAAYAFVEAIVVTPMGALSVVICAILSSFFLNETLSFFGWLGCGLCIVGSVVIALNGPQEQSIGQITQFQKMFLAPGFLVYGSVLIAAALVIIIYFAPRYGKKSMLWYIMVCSMIGGISVSVTTGLGAAIVTTAMGDNQFKHWFIYFLMVFIVVTLITEVYYLNVALALFNTAMVTPTYYVVFTFFSILTTIVLFQGLKAPPSQIITLVMGFLVICFGITILQLSKVDPTQIKGLDRRSTILLQAARNNTEGIDEKNLGAIEDPGMDALRGSFGTVGSIIRAKSAKRMSQSSRGTASTLRSRYQPQRGSETPLPLAGNQTPEYLQGVQRHQLYDPPMPDRYASPDGTSDRSVGSQLTAPSVFGLPSSPRNGGKRSQTIKFGAEDTVHQYHTPGTGDGTATHERRSALHSAPGSPNRQPDKFRALPLPPIEEPEEPFGLRSAPPVLDNLNLSNPFYQPHAVDPFENSPSTTTLATFPSMSSTSTSQLIPSDSPTDTIKKSSPTTPDRKTGSSSSHHHNIFGHSPSGGKSYPRGDSQDDREESMSLWRPSEDSGTSPPDLAPSSIRLVPNRRF